MRRLFVLLAAFMGVPLSIALAGGTHESQSSRNELVDTVIAGISQNDSGLQTVQATYEVSIENVGIDKEIKQESKGKGGGTLTIDIQPKSEFIVKYTSHGAATKWESQGQIVLSKDGIETQYLPNEHHAWIRRQQDSRSIGFPPTDFRRIGLRRDPRYIAQILAEDKIVDAMFVDVDQRKRIRVVLDSGLGGNAKYEFDPSRSLLPTNAYSLDSNGNVAESIEFGYRECAPGTWILESAKSEMFAMEGGHSRVTAITRLKLTVLDMKPMVSDQDFEPNFPDGTYVNDNVQGKIYTVGAQLPPTSQSTLGRKWQRRVLVISLLTLSGAFLIYRARAYYKRRSVPGVSAKGGGD